MQATTTAAIKRIYSYIFAHKLQLFAGLVCSVLLGMIEALIPWVMKLILDADGKEGWVSLQELTYVLPIVILLLFITRGIVNFGKVYLQKWMESTIVTDIRKDLVSKIVCLPNAYFDSEPTGSLISRLLLYGERMVNFSMAILTVSLRETTRFLGLLLTMFLVSWQYTIIIFSILPIVVLIVRWANKKIYKQAQIVAITEGEFSAGLTESVQAQRIVKAYEGQESEQSRLSAILNKLRGAGIRQGTAIALNQPTTQLVVAIAISFIFWLLSVDLANDRISEGDIGTFLLAILLLPVSLKSLISVSEYYKQALAASERIFEVLDKSPEPDSGKYNPKTIVGALQFEKVNFAYAGNAKESLTNLSLSVAAGEFIALVGSSGGGKSSIINLLLRFYQQNSGKILLDQHDINDYQLSRLRSAFSLVTQDIVLFSATVMENITYPDTGNAVNQGRLKKAISYAALEDMIARLEDGLDTRLGERGNRLSGGEQQRLSIARALYRDAPILLLDEATSSLDSVTEEVIKQSLKQLAVKKTIIAIAHRLTTVELADRVAVIEQGQITALGTHDELLKKSELYQHMCKL